MLLPIYWKYRKNIVLENITCLLSKSKNLKRATIYTVETISLDIPQKKEKNWIGINLISSNKYVEYFLKKGLFNNMIYEINSIKREIKLGNSKIDFLINKDCYLEVKSFLQILNMNIPNYIKLKKILKINPGERIIKHMIELSKSLKKNERGIMLLVYQYNSSKFKIKLDKSKIKDYNKFDDALNKFNNSGIELWQTNLSIDKYGVSLSDYYKLDSHNLFETKLN